MDKAAGTFTEFNVIEDTSTPHFIRLYDDVVRRLEPVVQTATKPVEGVLVGTIDRGENVTLHVKDFAQGGASAGVIGWYRTAAELALNPADSERVTGSKSAGPGLVLLLQPSKEDVAVGVFFVSDAGELVASRRTVEFPLNLRELGAEEGTPATAATTPPQPAPSATPSPAAPPAAKSPAPVAAASPPPAAKTPAPPQAPSAAKSLAPVAPKTPPPAAAKAPSTVAVSASAAKSATPVATATATPTPAKGPSAAVAKPATPAAPKPSAPVSPPPVTPVAAPAAEQKKGSRGLWWVLGTAVLMGGGLFGVIKLRNDQGQPATPPAATAEAPAPTAQPPAEQPQTPSASKPVTPPVESAKPAAPPPQVTQAKPTPPAVQTTPQAIPQATPPSRPPARVDSAPAASQPEPVQSEPVSNTSVPPVTAQPKPAQPKPEAPQAQAPATQPTQTQTTVPPPKPAPTPAQQAPISPPRPLSQTGPMIPESVRRSLRGEVVVRVEVNVDAQGKVLNAVPVVADNRNAALAKAVADSVRGWKFAPATQGANRVPGATTLTFTFRDR